MKLDIAALKDDRTWAAVTGMSQARFAKRLPLFRASYLELHGKPVAERQMGLAIPPSLPSEEDLLLFTLFSLKCGLTYDALAFVCGMDRANAKRNQTRGLEVLQHALAQAGCLPERRFATPAEFAAVLQDEPKLLIDGVEQRTQRPPEHAAQADGYSGKKMPHAQGADYFQRGAPDSLPQFVLGGQDARLPPVQGRIPAHGGLVQGTRTAR